MVAAPATTCQVSFGLSMSAALRSPVSAGEAGFGVHAAGLVTCPLPSPVESSLMFATNVSRYPPLAVVTDTLCTSGRSLSANVTMPVCVGGGMSSITPPVELAWVIVGALFGSGGGSGGDGMEGTEPAVKAGGRNGQSGGADDVSWCGSIDRSLPDRSEESGSTCSASGPTK